MMSQEERWMTVGEAARHAGGVDRRTIRRWADRGIVKSRLTPGGHRQIDMASLEAAFRQPGRKRRQPSVDPVLAVGEWADGAYDWPHWRPDPRLDEHTLQKMAESAHELIADLEGLCDVIDDRIAMIRIEREDFASWKPERHKTFDADLDD